MKFLHDFFPIILFFVFFKLYGIYAATLAAIVAAVAQSALFWLRHRRLEKMHVINLVLIVVFGGATLVFQDETFIKWKPTILNWLFGAVFLASHFIGEKTVIERMLGANITLPAPLWSRLNFSWGMFFILLGVTNLYVAFNFATETWVDFKVFGLMGLTLLFVMLQVLYLSRRMAAIEQPHKD